MDEKKKEGVLSLLKEDCEGLTVIEIAGFLKISRNTCAVVLANLEGAGLIRVREVGKCKLHYLNGVKKK